MTLSDNFQKNYLKINLKENNFNNLFKIDKTLYKLS